MIWRNLNRHIKINRNPISEELLKLGEGQKILIFKGRVGGGGAYYMTVRSEKFYFQGGLALKKGGLIFWGDVHTPLHTVSCLLLIDYCSTAFYYFCHWHIALPHSDPNKKYQQIVLE